MILLPVMALAIVSLASLRQDEQTAERDSRKRAAEDVQSLARAIRSTVSEELQHFWVLQDQWMIELRLAGQPSIVHSNRSAGFDFPSDKSLRAEINQWEQNHPGFRFVDLASAEGDLLTDGRQIEPPDFPAIPVPPMWFLELSPKQRELWQALRQAEAAGSNPAEIKTTHESFLAADVSPEAQAAAGYVLRTQQMMLGNFNPISTETGITFQELACYRLLKDSDAPLSSPLLDILWRQVSEHPSFVSPTLLDLAEGLTNRSDGDVRDHVHWMRQYWNSQSRAREWLEPLRLLPSLSHWEPKYWSHWTTGNSGDALAFSEPGTFTNMGSDSQGVPFSGRGYVIWFVPRPFVEAIFSKALAENKFLIPDYAAAVLTVDGIPLRLQSNAIVREEKSLLGTATQSFGTQSMVDMGNFELKFYLTSRKLMLSAERRRAKLFGALIGVAALAALAGFVAARRAFSRQLRLSEMKSNFVSSVSHELRAPIASVRLMAEGLERGKIQAPEKQQEYFHFIVQECRRLSSLIENVLDFSRIEQGRKQYELESTDLEALTEQTVKLMETYAAEQRIGITLSVSGQPVPVEVDGKAIQQALINLIDNAIKHSPKNAIISVGLEFGNAVDGEHPEGWTPNGVRLWVEDKGEGIPRAEQERIFERFYRIGSELRRQTQGVGIGLSIVKHIVEGHRGRVVVRSAVGEGSRFTIELPGLDRGGGKRS